MSDSVFDLVVIGGGSGGIACARRAARYGAQVALIEEGRLGGTCVNVGCVPKKVMWHAAGFAHALHDAPGYGFEVTRGDLDWNELRKRRDAYIRRLNGIYADGLIADKIEQIDGRGRLESSSVVRVGERRIEARHVLIATGGRPVRPAIPGAELGIVSDDFFSLQSCPKKIAVAGSGYIAVELAGMLKALGANVSLLIRRDNVLREFDAALGSALLDHMQRDGIDVRSRCDIDAVEQADERLELQFRDATSESFDALLWAVGRSPNSSDLGLDAAGVDTDSAGNILTDDYQNTSQPAVFAVGDVTGRAALTPVAIAAGRRLADRLFGGQADRHLKYTLIPTVVFSHPCVATVGLSEAQAVESETRPVRVYESKFNALYYGILEEKRPTLIKLVTAGKNERVVGCHMVGVGADEMLQGFAVAVRMGATKQDFDDTIAIHPTSAEELVTLSEPVREYAD